VGAYTFEGYDVELVPVGSGRDRDKEVPDQLTEDDFYLPRFRYVAPRPYTREEYEHLHDWMTSWGLLKPESNYDRIVGAKIAAPG
jgi:hypothetical protein